MGKHSWLYYIMMMKINCAFKEEVKAWFPVSDLKYYFYSCQETSGLGGGCDSVLEGFLGEGLVDSSCLCFLLSTL